MTTEPMDDFPVNVWRDPQTLLWGLATINQALSAYLENVADVHAGNAQPLPTRVIASLGNGMVEVGNALQGKLVNNIPGDFLTPPIFTES